MVSILSVINTRCLWLVAAVLVAACSTKLPPKTASDTVTIIRDEYGMPHIFASDNYGVYFGYGYAVAQDRLFQMEMLKRSVEGRVAEVLGSDYIEFDSFIRTAYDGRSVARQLQALAPADREILQAYADGMNRYLQKLRAAPEALMPKEFIHYGFQPSNWTAANVAALFAGSIAHRYSDFNTELDNLNFLQSLQQQHGDKKGWQIFGATKWLFDSHSPVTAVTEKTAQAAGNRPPSYLKQLAAADRGLPQVAYAAGDTAPRIVDSKAPLIASQFAQRGSSGTPGFGSASNLWAVNGDKARGAKGIFINGPQFGWATPSYVYGIGLHGGDFDLVGNTLLAMPAMLFAHNNHIGWGSTAGFGDQVDLFEETLNPDNPEQYWHNGRYRDFERWQETIPVKGGKPVVVWARRSIHGMIQGYDASQPVAYAKARAWEGKEVQTLMAWVELSKQKQIDELPRLLDKVATNINFYVMDKHGNLFYRHGGHFPHRHKDHDSRLPIPGSGQYDWQGQRPGSDSPTVTNPPQNYLQNWNNRPGRGWSSPDLWWVTWGRADRSAVLIKELEARTAFTPQQLWDINSRSAYADVNLAYLRPYLKQALAQQRLSPAETAAWRRLENWAGYWVDSDENGFFDSAAPVIFERWLSLLLEDVIKDDVGAAFFTRFAPTGMPTAATVAGINLQPGTKILVRNLDALQQGQQPDFDFFNGQPPANVLLKAFRKATTQLLAEQGATVAEWRSKAHPLEFVTRNFRGIPQTLATIRYSLPVIQNRGTENNLFIARGTHIDAWDSVPAGQSGFISAAGVASPHHGDQLHTYYAFQKKRLAFSREAITVGSTETISIRRGRND